MRLTVNLLTLLTLACLFSSCKKETEQYTDTGEPLSDYLPLQAGKYIIYRTDSTVFTNTGHTMETHSYEEKDIIDAVVPDALGRPSYRIFRYMRDTLETQPWAPSSTYYITPVVDSNTRIYNRIEVIDNNMRVVKLAKSVKLNQTWKGNEYLGTDPFATLFGTDFQEDDNMGQWDFTITATGESLNINGKTYANVITVQAANELDNVPVVDPNRLATSVVSIDKYAKGVGLVYQEYSLWERQPATLNSIVYYNGFGVIRRIIDHN
jgi:hypothetical protein